MAAVLTTWQGRPACEIAAADGEVWTYCWTAKRLARGGWSLTLEKVEGGEVMAAYKVVLYTSGSWQCDCKQAIYRRGVCNAQGGCKHALAGMELVKVLAALGEQDSLPMGRSPVGSESSAQEEMENGNWIRKVTN